MSRQSIRNVFRTTGNALGAGGDAAAPAAAGAAAATSSLTSMTAATLSIRPAPLTLPIALSLSSSFSTSATTERRRSTASTSTFSPVPARQRLPSSCQGPHVRLLSSTAPRSAHAIEFSPSSSAELDAVLETIRTKILLPSYLRADQRRQLFSPKYEQKLRADPITLEIDGDVLRFQHMDLFRDVPNARAAARDAVGRMTTREDFDNLPRLLEGLHRANRRLRTADYARIARRAGERGCIYAVIESARTVRRTGFRLESSEIVAEILTHVQMKAADSGWAEDETRQALTWAELVVDLLEDENHGRRPPTQPQHSGGGGAAEASSSAAGGGGASTSAPPPPPPAFPLSRDPQVLAARLHLAAVVADKFPAPASAAAAAGEGTEEGTAAVATGTLATDVDANGKVARYAADLVRLWPAGKGLRQLHPAGAYTDRRGEMHYLSEDNKFLGVAAPLLHGLDTTIRVLSGSSSGEDTAVADELRSRRDALAAEVHSALAAAPDRRGAAIYNKLYGGGAAASEP